MTEEEKAREWVRTNSGYSTKEFHGKKAIEAFLAGVEAGKSQAETGLAIVAYMQGAERYKPEWLICKVLNGINQSGTRLLTETYQKMLAMFGLMKELVIMTMTAGGMTLVGCKMSLPGVSQSSRSNYV